MQSTLILSRKDGAIVRASGLLVADNTPAAPGNETISEQDSNSSVALLNDRRRDEDGENQNKGTPRTEADVARAVWKFFGAAGVMVDDMTGQSGGKGSEKDDEVRLLRMRLKRSEIVIVPGKLPIS